jgi:hypothetical protein
MRDSGWLGIFEISCQMKISFRFDGVRFYAEAFFEV